MQDVIRRGNEMIVASSCRYAKFAVAFMNYRTFYEDERESIWSAKLEKVKGKSLRE